MIKYEQPQYYAEDKVHICYAQGWSMIYFLRKSEQVAKKPEWAKILPTYFEILKATTPRSWRADCRRPRGGRAREGRCWPGGAHEGARAAFAGVD
jgi:hypothetical protein